MRTRMNGNEKAAYGSTIMQEDCQAIWDKIVETAWDMMGNHGVPESDLDTKVHADYVSGILAKLIKRHQDGEWPTVFAGDEVDVEMSVSD